MNYIERVLARLQGGDKARVERVLTQTKNYVKSQINLQKESLKKITENLEDAIADKTEAIEQPDLDQASNNENARNYAPKFVEKLNSFFVRIDELEENKAEIEAQIERYEEILNELK